MKTTSQPAMVWDLFIRIFHWSIAGAVIFNSFFSEEGDPPHTYVGYFAAGFVVARFVWGFIGSKHARFSDFFPTPQRVKNYILKIKNNEHPEMQGHNPLAAIFMLLMMLLILLLGVSGWMMSLDRFWGEEWLEEVHELLSNGLLFCVIIHLIGIALESKRTKKNIALSMITGKKCL